VQQVSDELEQFKLGRGWLPGKAPLPEEPTAQ
jgi:hypothetical protein